MKESGEMELHRKIKKFEDKQEVKTKWGKILVTLDAIPNYAGGKGCPDEILVIKAKFAILGVDVELSIPLLIELEKIGYPGAEEDLRKFCERSISGEQESYLEVPMIVIGGNDYKKLKSQKRQVTARVSIIQVPERVIK